MGSCQSAVADPTDKAAPAAAPQTYSDVVKGNEDSIGAAYKSPIPRKYAQPSTPTTAGLPSPDIPGPSQKPQVLTRAGVDGIDMPVLFSTEGKSLTELPVNLSKDTSTCSFEGLQENSSSSATCSVLGDNLSRWKSELADCSEKKRALVRIETDFGRAIEDVYDGVHDGPVLGTGVSGTVRRITHRETRVEYAVKCLDLDLVRTPESLAQLREEIFIMCQLDHPNIVRLDEVYEGSTELYLVQELCLGGDLFDRLDDQPDYRYTEAECARLVKQMLSALRYLHSRNIIHRDLKLENFLFSSTSKDSELKMIDFGLGKFMQKPGEVQCDAVGTPYSVAPEVLLGSYDERCDCWSIGVITYLLLSGETPFGGIDGEDAICVRNNILNGKFEMLGEGWHHVSQSARDFVRSLLQDADQRPNAEQAQNSRWIVEYTKRSSLEEEPLSGNIATSLLQFKSFSDIRKLLSQVLSFTLLPDQIKLLREDFEKIDADGTGEISLADLKHVFESSAIDGKLGAMTEAEVQEVFLALRVRKEPTICWHAFIAASLSQCSYDERNLKLAFSRIDYEGKGYVSREDMDELLGSYKDQEEMQKIWKELGSKSRITYDDFVLIMKGQPVCRNLGPEASQVLEEPYTRSPLQNVSAVERSPGLESIQEGQVTPQAHLRSVDLGCTSFSGIMLPNLKLVPNEENTSEQDLEKLPSIPRPPIRRMRSRSLGSEDEHSPSKEQLYHRRNYGQSRRQLSYGNILPSGAIEEIQQIHDTPLAVNRALYRKQKEMRQAVLQASREFDQKRLSLTAHSGKRASLTMRRGSTNALLAETAQNSCLDDDVGVRQGSVGPVTPSKPRRQRRPRMKTASDLTGML